MASTLPGMFVCIAALQSSMSRVKFLTQPA